MYRTIYHRYRFRENRWSWSQRTLTDSIEKSPAVNPIENISKAPKIVQLNQVTDNSQQSQSKIIDAEKSDKKFEEILMSRIPNNNDLVQQSDRRNLWNNHQLKLEDIPGPMPLKIMSKFWNFLPFVLSQMTSSLYKSIFNTETTFSIPLKFKPSTYIFKRYGTIVHLPGPFGGNVIMLSHPDHMAAILRQENFCIFCSNFDSIQNYRLTTRSQWFNEQKFTSNLTSKSIDSISAVKSMKLLSTIELISDEFVNRIGYIKNQRDEMPTNFYQEIMKWSFECVGHIMFNKRFALFDIDSVLIPHSESIQLYDSFMEITDAIQACEGGIQFWRKFETPAWNKLTYNLKIMERIIEKYVRDSIEKVDSKITASDSEELSIMDNLLINHKLSVTEAIIILVDMLIIGVNSASMAVAFTLYNLAINEREQYDLAVDLKRYLFEKQLNVIDNQSAMKYLQACTLESLRLHPPFPFVSRLIRNDIEINKYQIPKGTQIIMGNRFICLNEGNFWDATKFKPQRWLVMNFVKDQIHPYAMIPFGGGRSMNLIRYLIEDQVAIVIAKIIQKYYLQYHYGEIVATNKYISNPSKPLRFQVSIRD